MTSVKSFDEKQLIHSIDDVNSFRVPTVFLKDGLSLLKISHKSRKRVKLRVEPSEFKFIYELPKGKIYEFLVDDIKGLYHDETAQRFREEFGISKEFERQWISVAFFNHTKKKLKTLHLIADTNYDFRRVKSIFTGFKKLKDDIAQNFFLNLNELRDSTRNMVLEKAECQPRSGRESLSLQDVVKFTKRMNINLGERLISQAFRQASRSDQISCGKLSFEQFKNFVEILNERKDLDMIWQDIMRSKASMNFEEFQDFMIHEQHEVVETGILKKWFLTFDRGYKGSWTQQDLDAFLRSRMSSPVSEPYAKEGYFSRPLNEYFILSSHNTYLLGRQVMGESSVEGYIKALQRGCRCLEIDIWNSGNDADHEPLVNHGRTFTNGISLRNVVKTIKAYAFQATQFPLILSLENHCSPESQRKVISILTDTFGSMLVTEPLNTTACLPSPDSLKCRVLLKVKKTDFFTATQDDQSLMMSTSTTAASLSEGNEHQNSSLKIKLRKKTSTRAVIRPLSNLGVYIQGIKFRNFSLPESKTFNHCFSLSEKSINNILKDENKRHSLDKHNRLFLMRIYPSKIRLNSSNFNPIIYWNKGVQMVATNWQTYDLGQQLNEAMFNAPLGDGYVLKPKRLRVPVSKSNRSETTSDMNISKRFTIRIISAHQLPKPVDWSGDINPFLSLEIIGAKYTAWDSRSNHTSIIAGNGFNPIWNETLSGTFDSESELVFLKITVLSSNSTNAIVEPQEVGLVVQNIFDVKEGYRYFQLKDMCGEQLLYSSILAKISVI
ncbi:hypothetical protein CJJ07_001816 [Candidozyma auris]|nr:hypothetical protein CJJ07_001816 [[Candida] auris]